MPTEINSSNCYGPWGLSCDEIEEIEIIAIITVIPLLLRMLFAGVEADGLQPAVLG